MAISINTRAILFMNISMAGFTINDMIAKILTQGLPTAQLMLMRGATMMVLLLLLSVVLAPKGLMVRGKDATRVGMRGLFEILSTICFLAALPQMPFANLTAIIQSLPLAITLAAAVFLGETVGWRRIVAIITGFIGVMLVVQPGTDSFTEASVYGLLTVVFVVVRELYTRKVSSEVPSVVIAFWTVLMVTTAGAVGTGWGGWVDISLTQALYVVIAASLMVIGLLFGVMAMRQGDISLVQPFRYVSLLWAIFLGALVFDEIPSPMILLGSAIIVGSGLYSYVRDYQRNRQARRR